MGCYHLGMPIDRDFRKLPASTQAELRRVAVNMVLSGASRIEVADAVGVNRRLRRRWVRAYRNPEKQLWPAAGVADVPVSRKR